MSDQWFYKKSGFRWSFVNQIIRCWDGGHQPEVAEYVTSFYMRKQNAMFGGIGTIFVTSGRFSMTILLVYFVGNVNYYEG